MCEEAIWLYPSGCRPACIVDLDDPCKQRISAMTKVAAVRRKWVGGSLSGSAEKVGMWTIELTNISGMFFFPRGRTCMVVLEGCKRAEHEK